MQIYNITFIVESVIEQKWATYVDKELLPQISKNVHQIDLLKVEYIEGIQAVKGSTFSMQFYCVKSEHLEWIKNIGHQLVFLDFESVLMKKKCLIWQVLHFF